MDSIKQNSFFSKFFAFLEWKHNVTRENLAKDFLAGLTGAIVVLPQGVAFAAIAGMPPEYGLYAGIVPAIIAAFFGSSWHLVSGPTTAASIVLYSALSVMAEPGSHEYVKLALTLTFMVGIIQIALSLAKMGQIVNFISHSVVIGFTAGAAILIASNQIKNFFGIKIPRGAAFYEVVLGLFRQFSEINLYITLVAVVTLVSGILAKKFLKKIPYMIIAMGLGSILSVILNNTFGQETTGIVTVGALPSSLPPLSSPDFSFSLIKSLAPAAFAATLFALVEAVSIARSIGMKSGQHIDGNQEFFGQGLSNLFGSFFSGYVATGSFNRSGLNYESGAKTPLAAIFAGSMLAVIVLLVAPYASYLPNASMAAILFLVAWNLVDFHHIHDILLISKSETAILLTTFFSTLFLELEFAILLGVVLSLVIYLNRTSKPKIYSRVPDPKRLPKRNFTSNPDLPECPQFKILRIDGSLFFGATTHVRETMQDIEKANPDQKFILLLAQGINFVDLAGAEFLEEEAKHLRKIGGNLFFYKIKEGVCEKLNRGEFINTIGKENIFRSKEDAIHTIFTEHLDKNICAKCDKRIFLECKSVKKTGKK